MTHIIFVYRKLYERNGSDFSYGLVGKVRMLIATARIRMQIPDSLSQAETG